MNLKSTPNVFNKGHQLRSSGIADVTTGLVVVFK
jgi:hypothetical protein